MTLDKTQFKWFLRKRKYCNFSNVILTASKIIIYETIDYNFHNIRALTKITFKLIFLNNGFLKRGVTVSTPYIREMIKTKGIWSCEF